MPSDEHLLTLAQWFSPAYPVGAFAHSHGLEQLVAEGAVRGAAELREWLEDILTHGSGHSDGLFLAAAWRARSPGELEEIDAACRAFAAGRERLAELELQGAAFCRATAAAFGLALPTLSYPVAVGRAASLEGLPLPPVLLLYLQAFAANLVSAAQRLIPLGQTEAQTLIHALSPLLSRIAAGAESGDLSTLSGTAFLADISAMRHETRQPRIFRT